MVAGFLGNSIDATPALDAAQAGRRFLSAKIGGCIENVGRDAGRAKTLMGKGSRRTKPPMSEPTKKAMRHKMPENGRRQTGIRCRNKGQSAVRRVVEVL